MTKTKRKSPVRHKVKSHTRQNRPVHSYVRGSVKSSRLKKKKKINTKKSKVFITPEGVKLIRKKQTLYHITTKENTNKILQTGFKPKEDWWGYGTWVAPEPLLHYFDDDDVVFTLGITGNYVDIEDPENFKHKEFGGEFYNDRKRWNFLKRNNVDVVMADDEHWFVRSPNKIRILSTTKVKDWKRR